MMSRPACQHQHSTTLRILLSLARGIPRRFLRMPLAAAQRGILPCKLVVYVLYVTGVLGLCKNPILLAVYLPWFPYLCNLI